METSLATNGLPELSLSGLATTDTVGGSSKAVQDACERLYTCASDLDTFITELETQKEAILKGWEGKAADMLRSQFPGLIDAFTQIPPSIRTVADWATSTMSDLVNADDETAARISQIMGGK